MLREKILEYLYDINARCDYKLEEIAYDIIDIVNEEQEQLQESEKHWHNIIGL